MFEWEALFTLGYIGIIVIEKSTRYTETNFNKNVNNGGGELERQLKCVKEGTLKLAAIKKAAHIKKTVTMTNKKWGFELLSICGGEWRLHFKSKQS